MKNEMDVKVTKTKAKSAQNTKAKTRRKFLQASPALLLLANRPAFAASCSISGFMSVQVGTSLTTHDGDLCNGWSPGNWKNNRGQITHDSWSLAGVSPDESFKGRFNSGGLIGGSIRKVTQLPDGSSQVETLDFVESHQNLSFYDALRKSVVGRDQKGDIIRHATASLLNSLFIKNGGAGSNPDDWMIGYINPEDIIGLYLIWELKYDTSAKFDADVNFEYVRGDSVIASTTHLSVSDIASFFVSMADGKGSQDWQDGL